MPNSNVIELITWDSERNPTTGFFDLMHYCEKYPLTPTKLEEYKNSMSAFKDDHYMALFLVNEGISWWKKSMILTTLTNNAPNYKTALLWAVCLFMGREKERTEGEVWFYKECLHGYQKEDTLNNRYTILSRFHLESYLSALDDLMPPQAPEESDAIIGLILQTSNALVHNSPESLVDAWNRCWNKFSLNKYRVVLLALAFKMQHSRQLKGVSLPESLAEALVVMNSIEHGRYLDKEARTWAAIGALFLRRKSA